jgi:hypothetical protein
MWKTLSFLFISASCFAATASFNFESEASATVPSPFAVSNNGLTLTISTEGYPSGYVSIVDFLIDNLGTRSVTGLKTDQFLPENFAPLRFSFSQPITAITFAFGDPGGDADSPVVIQGFDAQDNFLGSLTSTYPAGSSTGKLISGIFAGASYFTLTSGTHTPGSNSDSLSWEVPSVEFTPAPPVPEPSTWAMGGVAIGLLAGLRKFRG